MKSTNQNTNNLKEYNYEAARKKYKFSVCVIILSIISFIFLYFVIEYDSLNDIGNEEILIAIVAGVLFIAFAVVYTRFVFTMKELNYKSNIVQDEIEKISDNKYDIFENSLALSYKYLDQYYLQTREQAQKGFVVTVTICIIGGFIIGIGIFTLFLEMGEPAYITTACGIIVEFVATVFFYLYNKTVSSMSSYHDKLVFSQNIAIALKLSDTMQHHSDLAKLNIIKELTQNLNSSISKQKK